MSGWKYSFSLSKEEVSEATPPGTARLRIYKDESTSASRRSSACLVRFPQPSEDPADPLNWPSWRKFALVLTVGLYAFAGNFNSASIASGLQLWFQTFPTQIRPLSELTYFIAISTLFLGASNIWWVPLSNILGRRPVLLMATVLMTVSTIWCAVATSYNSVLVARIFQAIGSGASETVAPALIGEVFFVDERGRAMAVYTVLLASGPLIGGIAGGYIGFQLGWAYIFWVSAAISGACVIAVFFFIPETLYDRVVSSSDPATTNMPNFDEKGMDKHIEYPPPGHYQVPHYAPYTFARSLAFTHYRGAVLRHFIAPWRTLALPGTWVVMFHYAGLVGGIVTISTIGPQLMAAPPYLWGANVGLINIGGIVGTVFGALYTYLLSDARLKKTVKTTRGGLAEPESRLPTMFPALAIATGGFFTFGFVAEYPSKNGWVGLCFGYGMVAFGLMQVPSIGFNYLIDSYGRLSGDCFVIVTIMRAIIAFAWTFFVSHWVEEKGPVEPFGIFGMLMGIFSLLTVPLWLYGKRTRIATRELVERT